MLLIACVLSARFTHYTRLNTAAAFSLLTLALNALHSPSYSLSTDLCVLLSACGPKNIVPGNIVWERGQLHL